MHANNRLLFVVCSMILAVSWVSAASGECLSVRGEKQEVIDAPEILNNEQNVLECLAFSLQKGKVNQARSILDLYGQQYEASIIKVIEKELHRLELIEEDIVQGESNCVPVAKWGQNQTHLFIVTKMSHRWDSPPCLNTKIQNVQLFNNTFEYINVCLVSHQKITFNLTLGLYSDVKGQVKVVNEGVGTFSVIIEKAETQVWPFLTKEETIYQIWNQIAQRYNPVHKQYTDLLNSKLKERKSKPVNYDNSTASDKKRTKNKENSQNSQPKEQREAGQAELIQADQNSGNADEVTLQTLEQLQNEKRTTLKIEQAVSQNQEQGQSSKVADQIQNSMEIKLQNGQ